MRAIYLKDQTKEFMNQEYTIVFLGNLYLKGKPYTKYNEAVDKEYTDYTFDNIREGNLKGLIKDSSFPAFNGDLINTQRTNNFVLKRVVLANTYHRPMFDGNGRITGGSTGKIKLNSNDFTTIDFDRLTYNKYKNTNGVFGKPDKIADFANGFNNNDYLPRTRDIHIYRPLAIDSGPVTADNIINEDDMLKITDQYFIGEISGQKEKDLFGYGDWGDQMSQYPNINMQPWKRQRVFCDKFPNQLKNPKIIFDRGDGLTTYSGSIYEGNLIVDEGYLYAFDPYWNGDPWSIRLTKEGKIPEDFTFIKNFTGHREGTNAVSCDSVYCINGRYFSRILYEFVPAQWVPVIWQVVEIIFENGTMKTIDRRTPGAGNGSLFIDFGKLFFGTRSVTIPSVYGTNDDRGVMRHIETLPGNLNLTATDDNYYGEVNNFITIGFYVYSFPSTGVISRPQRIKLSSGIPTGEWEFVDVGLTFPATRIEYFTVKDTLYLFYTYNKTLFVQEFELDRKSNMNFKRTLYEVTLKSPERVTSVCASKGSLFIAGWDWLVEFDLKGVANGFREMSYRDYKPPYL